MIVFSKRLSILMTIILIAVCLLSCSNITEQEMIYDAGLHIVSAESMQIVKTIPGIRNASALMIYPGKLFMASRDGIVRCYDSNDLSLLGEYNVGAASPAGYSDLVFSPTENTAYLIGAMGKILELSIPDCEVLDEFSVSQAPVLLAVTSGVPGDLWVVDGPHNTIDRVDIQVNESSKTMNLSSYTIIQSIEPSGYYSDSLLVGTSHGIYKLEATEYGNTRLVYLARYGSSSSWTGFCSIPHDSNYIAIKNGTTIGELCVYDNGLPYPAVGLSNTSYIEGNGWITAAGNDYINMYALGSLGDGTCRLYRYTYIGPSYGVNGYADFNGYPVDMKISDSGQIYILTVEQ